MAGSAGNTLGYLEHLPPGYAEADTPAPLLVYLHGSGGGGAGTEASLQKILSEDGGIPTLIADGTWPVDVPFVVLAPQYSDYDANTDCDFGDDLEVFLDEMTQSYRIDQQRIYLTGISCGAIGIWDYLATTEDSAAAAVVPINGHPDWAMDKAGCEIVRTPTWAFHGALDPIIPADWLQERFDELAACKDPKPTELTLTVYPDREHDAWIPTYDRSAGNDIYSWMLDHKRASAN